MHALIWGCVSRNHLKVFSLLSAGAHGVYLIPSDQCPTAFPAGPNELYAASAPTSVNNVLSMNLTTPGIFYFACQVIFAFFNPFLFPVGEAQIHLACLAAAEGG